MKNDFNLERFVRAQDAVFAQVLKELGQGRKQSHWMWFVFPQVRGLGQSQMASEYAIASAAEAQAYLSHAVLGQRLTECTGIVNGLEDRSAIQIFGHTDAMKFRSSMTLFAHVSEAGSVFHQALEKYFQGSEDTLTLERL